MLKNYITLALLFAVCWNFNAEAFMGMSASKALSYNNTVRGRTSSGSSETSATNSGRQMTVKKNEHNPSTHTITMASQKSSEVETKNQILKAGDYLNVILPSSSWEVDSENCNETHTITNTRISFKILGISGEGQSCEIKLYGFNTETAQMLNKLISLTVN